MTPEINMAHTSVKYLDLYIRLVLSLPFHLKGLAYTLENEGVFRGIMGYWEESVLFLDLVCKSWVLVLG